MTQVMDCQQFRDALDCYIDGELSVEATTAADAHRRECPSCNRAAARLLSVKAGVKRTVGATAVPALLESRVRAAVTPRWSERMRFRPRSRAGLAAIAVAAVVLLLVAASVGARASGRTIAANAMDRLALLLDDSSPVEIEGTILCRDCELEHRYGVKATCDVIGHHGAIATTDGRIWNIVEQPSSVSLIHDESLLGRKVLVHGRLFRGAGSLVVERYETHGSSVVARVY